MASLIKRYCVDCGRRFRVRTEDGTCPTCSHAKPTVVPIPVRPKQQHATHIAGYVPARGWTAYGLLGRVVAPVRGMGV